jgi:hypothetical protein
LPTTVLSPAEVAAFEDRGYVGLPRAFPEEAALAMQQSMWRELNEEFGIERDDRSTWRTPPHDLRRSKVDPTQQAMNTPRLLGACNELLDAGTWNPLTSWGRVLLTFPVESERAWTVPTEVWHWDCELRENLDRVERLTVFTFFSEVGPRGGGTVIVEGSHRVLRSFYEELSPEERGLGHRKLRKKFLTWDPWLKRLAGLDIVAADRNRFLMDALGDVRGVPVRVVELTGRPGDAFLCHPLILHATSPNHGDWPRFMRIKFPGQSRVTGST